MALDERRELGTRAEKRVVEKLRSSVTIVEDKSRIYPDFRFEIQSALVYRPMVYGVEVKTMKGFYEGEKVGILGISKEEFDAYEKLSHDLNLLLIVEVRPRKYHWSKYLHYVVEWSAVRERYLETKPNNLRLSLWWVLSYGTKLEDWIKLVCS